MPVAARTLTIGSRGSQLALWQANYIAGELRLLGVDSRIEIIKTTGDHLQTASLMQAGGKGLFTKEIEEALLEGSIDLAVHSLKDLPTETRDGLTIAAIPEREDARDVLLGRELHQLAAGACVGTSSGRRAAQLRSLRPDLAVEPVRGNVDTRIRKMREGQYDALILAAAGLSRLGLSAQICYSFSPEEICPAPGQGALAIETRAEDEASEVCKSLDHQPTSRAVTCERTVLAALGGGCQLPVGVYARIQGEQISAQAVVAALDGRQCLRLRRTGSVQEPEVLGIWMGEELVRMGARTLLTAVAE